MSFEITEPAVENYIYDILPERDTVLQEMERQAEERDIPIVGPAVARVLYQYARLINAKRVFELGSAIGYSTIWWARAVGDGGEVFYTDSDPAKAAEAQGIFSAPASRRVFRLVLETRWSCFLNRSSSLTSSLMMLIRNLIRECCTCCQIGCAKVDCS